ncbi:MAG: hypothetical protein ACKVT0_19615 [Planctomycetaceae bacterium]
MIEQQLLSQPQILVVEFAEAEALMRERVIDARDEKVRRLLPHYLLGEYRNEGKEDERKVKITITHKQGEEELASIKGETIPNEAPKFLQKSVAEIIEQQTGKPSVPPDPKREAAQLLLRAKEYLTLGDYEDAAALAEASLLLEPEQIEPHVVAIRALTPLVEKHWWNGQNNIEESKIAMSHYLRGVDHLIGFYREGGNEDDYLETGQTTFIPMFMSATNGLSIHVKNDELAEIKNFMTEIHIRNRAAMLTLFELRIGHDHRAASGFLGWACVGLNDNETEDLRIEMILKHQDRPDISQIVHTLSTAGTTIDRLDTPLGRKLLEELEKHGNDSVKKTVAQLRIERDEYIARYEAELKKPVAKMALDPVPPGEPHVGFEPISFDWTDSNNASGELKGANGWLATEAGFDVVCSGNSLFLMRERGKLRRVWTADSINSYISRTEHNAAQSDFCYDGRYVWFTFTERLKDGRLFLCDPESEKVHELTAKHGLPNPNEGKTDVQRVYQKLSLAPVGPGKIMLAGYFGRAWIAMVTYDEENDGEVKVFHEAVEVEDRADADQWRSNLIRFSPSYMRALNVYDDGLNLDSRKILIYRGAEHPDAGDHPLVIDPETFNVEVMEQRILSGFNFDVRNGIIYMVYPAPPNYESLALFRVGLPGPTVEPILPVKFSGHVVADKEKIHIVGKQWWIADLEEKTVTPAGPVPWIYNSSFAVDYSKIEIFDGVKIQLDFLARSNHYGIIAVYRNTVDMQTTSQVTFTK